MLLLVVLIGVIIIAFSAFALYKPAFLRHSIEYWLEPGRLYLAMTIRICVGILLFAVASQARSPVLMRALGALMILAGVTIPVLGFDRIRTLADWWQDRSDTVLRVWGLAAAGLGALLIYAAT